MEPSNSTNELPENDDAVTAQGLWRLRRPKLGASSADFLAVVRAPSCSATADGCGCAAEEARGRDALRGGVRGDSAHGCTLPRCRRRRWRETDEPKVLLMC